MVMRIPKLCGVLLITALVGSACGEGAPGTKKKPVTAQVPPPGEDQNEDEDGDGVKPPSPDTTSPETWLAATPDAVTADTTATFDFSGADASGIKLFRCSLDTAPFADCTSPASYPGLATGPHTFRVAAVDIAGNVDANPAEFTWVIDTTPPEISIQSGPTAVTRETAATFAFAATDANGIRSLRCSLDGGPFSECAPPKQYSGLASGLHDFRIEATDVAGNSVANPAHAWIIDITAPQSVITSGPAVTTDDSSATFAFTASDTNGIKQILCRLDAAPFAPCNSPHSFASLAPGTYTFEVKAVDNAGNLESIPASHTWTITAEELPAFVQNVLWTERLGQLVGTSRSPYSQVGLKGTDLGVAFPRDDQLVFLFGDSWTINGAEWDVDSVVLADPEYPADGQLPLMTWLTRPGGRFLPLTVPGVALGGMNVPVDGFAVGATTYVFFSTGYSGNPAKHTHSVLAHTTGFNFGTMTLDHMVPSAKFININVILQGETAYLFGSGPYRASPIYLARAPIATITNRATWEYYRSGSGGMAVYGPDESTAAVLVNTSDVGEFSVRKHPKLDLWLMAYQTGGIVGVPRGVHLRTATHPAGPWSAPTRIWNPDVHGYGHFMHQRLDTVGFDDGLSEPGRDNEWGGEYGPYFVPEWFDGPETPEGAYSLVYLLSSWNPYTVHLIRTVMGPAGSASKPVKGSGLPAPVIVNPSFNSGLTGWSASGHTFRTFNDGTRNWLTTYVLDDESNGCDPDECDAATGKLWQDFTINSTTNELRFLVHGGNASVKLIHKGDVVRETRGRNQNSPNTSVRWKLTEYQGETVRLVIDDDKTGPWGFIGVTGFTFQ